MEDIVLHAGSGPHSAVAINEENLSTVFQPIVRLGNRERTVFGYEALTRGPSGSPLEDPTKMFLCAYEQGNLLEVDMMCLRKTFRHSRGFPSGPKIFVNIHPHSLGKSTKAASDILNLIASVGMVPGQFVMEIVEQFPVHTHDVFIGNVMMLRKGGVLIGLDDVGAGYSDFFFLSKIKPEFLKVNGYFADHIRMNTIKQKVLRAIVDLSQDIKAQVIAEGIEREEDLKTIESLGAHLGQGYYFARPTDFNNLKIQ